MQSYLLKKKLQNNELTIGSWISFGFPQTCEIMAKAGFDWLVVDMEHAAISQSQCLNLIQIIESNGVTPLVRVGKNDPFHIKQAMDAGAHGIIVPMVNTKEDAQKAIDALYYPPLGNRGVGLARAQNYGNGFEAYRVWADTDTIFIPQIEHFEGVKNLNSIMSLEYVDAFIVGPYDLSGSLGVPGQWNHPLFSQAMGKVTNFIKTSIKPGGFHVVHSVREKVESCIQEGYGLIAYGDDMVFFSDTIASEKEFLSIKRN